ncbi:LysE family translocator [Motiliproteus sp.]|uniref:LysE family translocator n=1 Tax=Motiliproteus sp. TaxID=1898955 RepID=UPI003BA98F71
MSLILAMSLFSLSMSISPGPINLISLNTGANVGFKRAFGFVSGATVGFTLLLLLIGLVVEASIELATQSATGPDSGRRDVVDNGLTLIGYLGAAYLGYLGWRIATADTRLNASEQSTPSFIQGAALQWLNPKAWIACLTGVSAFRLAGDTQLLLQFSSLYFVICYLSIASWAWAGARLGLLLGSSKRLRWLNRSMGASLILLAGYLMLFAEQPSL